MSAAAMKWAARQQCERPADKLVLFGLADCVNEAEAQAEAWPSLAWLEAFTGLDRKTTIAAMGRLMAAGLVADTGRRVGKTGQVKVLALAINGAVYTIPKTAPLAAKGAGNTIPKTAPFEGKASQKRHPEPSLVTFSEASPPSRSLVQPAPAADEAEAVMLAWNAMAKAQGLPLVAALNAGRRQKVKARIAEHGADALTAAIAKVGASDFCTGRTGSWRANFDFLLQPSSFVKIMEGNYDNRLAGNGRTAPQQPRPGDGLAAAVERRLARLGGGLGGEAAGPIIEREANRGGQFALIDGGRA